MINLLDEPIDQDQGAVRKDLASRHLVGHNMTQYLGPIVLPFFVRPNCGDYRLMNRERRAHDLLELESSMDHIQIEQKTYKMPREMR